MKTTVHDLERGQLDLGKSDVKVRSESLMRELENARKATTTKDFENAIHMARLHLHKVQSELHWYFGSSDE